MSKTFFVVAYPFQNFRAQKFSFSFSFQQINYFAITSQCRMSICTLGRYENRRWTYAKKGDRQQNGKSGFKMKLLYKVVCEITQLTECNIKSEVEKLLRSFVILKDHHFVDVSPSQALCVRNLLI